MSQTYENAILRIRQIMEDISNDKTIKGKDIFNLAINIINALLIKYDEFLSLINNLAMYNKENGYLYPHSLNVAILVTNLGLASGYGRSRLVDLCAAALVHDIGMLKIPQEIIEKPGKLTKKEYELVKKHPIYGIRFLNNIIDSTKTESEVVYQHHEKKDGTGYPEGKRGDEISKHAQIVSIAEVYEALTHPRPFRSYRIIPFKAVKMIIQETGSHFDPQLVKVFFNCITPYPIGSYVLLYTNEIGRVIRVNKNLPLRPHIEIVLDSEGKPPEKPRRIDLAKSHILYIKKAIDEKDLHFSFRSKESSS